MQKKLFPGSISTPSVLLDPIQNIIKIEGPSFPENATKFYTPIYDWVSQYLDSIPKTTKVLVTLNISYINAGSSKHIFNLLQLFDEAYLANKDIAIQWYYEQNDAIELENIQDYQADVSIPIRIIPKK